MDYNPYSENVIAAKILNTLAVLQLNYDLGIIKRSSKAQIVGII